MCFSWVEQSPLYTENGASQASSVGAKTGMSDDFWQRYFYEFNYAAAIQRGK